MSVERDNTYLTLTNDQRFYSWIIPFMQKSKTNNADWLRMRSKIYDRIRNQTEARIGFGVDTNTAIMFDILEYYSQEAWGVHVLSDKIATYIADNFTKHCSENSCNSITEPQPQDTTMKPNDVIVSRVYILGSEASTQTDDQLFEKITTVDEEIARLDAIKTKPAALKTRIKEMKAALADVVAYMDERSDG